MMDYDILLHIYIHTVHLSYKLTVEYIWCSIVNCEQVWGYNSRMFNSLHPILFNN